MISNRKKTKKASLYDNVAWQFDKASDLMGLDPKIRKILATTENELIVHFPVKMDNGQIKMFTGYRVQHNSALGPFKGGIRFHPLGDLNEIRALATLMTWKSAITDYAKNHGGIFGYPNAKPIDHQTFLSTKAEIFIPAALENLITADTAPLLNVKLAAEGANGPTNPDGDMVLQSKAIDVIPDILCNSGGLIAATSNGSKTSEANSGKLMR